jgi:hypothetical protein
MVDQELEPLKVLNTVIKNDLQKLRLNVRIFNKHFLISNKVLQF